MKLFVLNLLLLVGVSSCSSLDEDEFFNQEKGKREIGSMYVYEDVVFTHNGSAKFFSVSTGEMYSEENVNSIKAVSNAIDLIGNSNIVKIAFKSPSKNNATSASKEKKTKIQHRNVEMTTEQFDAIKEVETLKNLTVTNDNGSKTIFFKGIFLFETSNGKKGAIKVKDHDLKQIIVDIKVMK